MIRPGAGRDPRGRGAHGGLVVRSDEDVVVATRAHPVKLLAPALITWCTVLCYSGLRRLLELTWRPHGQPWVAVHSALGWAIALAALWVVLRYAVLPAWRWLRTRFVLTSQRLALTGPHARDGAVSLPLAALHEVRVVRPGGLPSALARRPERGTVIADFGSLGGLKLVGCPRPATMRELIERASRGAAHYSGHGMDAPPHGRYQGGPRG